MGKLLKNGNLGIVSQFHDIQSFETPSQPIPLDMQLVLSKHQSVFETPQGITPTCGAHDLSIPLIPSIPPPNFHPYHHPFAKKMKLKRLFKNC